jgi:hypothetical protein
MAHALQRLALEPDSVGLSETELTAIHDGCTAAIFSAYMLVHYAHGKGGPGMEELTVPDDDFARAQAWGQWQELYRNVGVMEFVKRAERHFPRNDARLADKSGANMHEAAAYLAGHIYSIAQNHWLMPRCVSPELSARECWDQAWPTIRAHLRQVELFDVSAATNALRREYLDASDSLAAPNKAREASTVGAGDTRSDAGDCTGPNQKAGSPMSASFGHVPQALSHAHKELVAKLDEETKQRRNPQTFVWRVEQFVVALDQIEGGRDELQRRATLVEILCGRKSEFQKARNLFWKHCRDLPPLRRTEPIRRILPLSEAGKVVNLFAVRPPELLSDVDEFRRYIEKTSRDKVVVEEEWQEIATKSGGIRKVKGLGPSVTKTALEHGPLKGRPEALAALERWWKACQAIQHAAAPLEVDGCYWLFHVHEAGKEKPADWPLSLGGDDLKLIRSAAGSLVNWAKRQVKPDAAPRGESGDDHRPIAPVDAATAACDKWLIQHWEKGTTLAKIRGQFQRKSPNWCPPATESGVRHRIDAAYRRAGKTRPKRPQGRRATIR